MVDTETPQDRVNDSPPMRSRLAVIVVGVVVGIAILVGMATVAARVVSPGSSWDVEPGIAVEVAVARGSSAREIYAVLHDAGVAPSVELESAAKSLGVQERLRAGTYALETGMDPELVVRQLVEGPNVDSDDTFTLIEGWTIRRIIEELGESTAFTEDEYEDVLRSNAVSSPYLPETSATIDTLTRWEGLLFPAKYPIGPDDSASDIVGAMTDEMTRRLSATDWSRIGELKVSRYEALIIGSLIEREAANDDERPTIASAIYNRLAIPMRLQIDATVIYALGHNPGRVLSEHLEVDSPYNTYRVDGLPPTPIGSLSEASIRAATDPASTPYLFYVLGGPDGSHLFAETYEEHQANIAGAKAAGILP